jgi:predicted ATPase
MAQQPFLKSIRPVNLLSFGPNTEEIELRPLNILIGPNGSGKSNLIEAIRLLHFLPDKDPWSVVLATGGVTEWIWKGVKSRDSQSSLYASFYLGDITGGSAPRPQLTDLKIDLDKYESSFRVSNESIGTVSEEGKRSTMYSWFERSGSQGEIHLRFGRSDAGPIRFDLHPDRSILSQLSSPNLQAYGVGQNLPELFEMAEFFENFDFHQDWEFGVDCSPRDPQPVGQAVGRLDEDGFNLAQMLAHYRDNHKTVFEQLGNPCAGA